MAPLRIFAPKGLGDTVTFTGITRFLESWFAKELPAVKGCDTKRVRIISHAERKHCYSEGIMRAGVLLVGDQQAATFVYLVTKDDGTVIATAPKEFEVIGPGEANTQSVNPPACKGDVPPAAPKEYTPTNIGFKTGEQYKDKRVRVTNAARFPGFLLESGYVKTVIADGSDIRFDVALDRGGMLRSIHLEEVAIL